MVLPKGAVSLLLSFLSLYTDVGLVVTKTAHSSAAHANPNPPMWFILATKCSFFHLYCTGFLKGQALKHQNIFISIETHII